MSLKAPLPLTVLALTSLSAQAAAPAQAGLPASWNRATLAGATYVILEPVMLGNPKLVGDADRKVILDAMKRDSAGALKRRYPQATIATDLNTPGAIKVAPVMVTPSALLPWASLTARLEFTLPEGSKVILNDSFGLITLWQQRAEAANYVTDQLVLKMP